MVETLAPYFSILPVGLAIVIAMLGPIPGIANLVRARKKPVSKAQTALAGSAGLIGAWACLNVVTPLLTAS